MSLQSMQQLAETFQSGQSGGLAGQRSHACVSEGMLHVAAARGVCGFMNSETQA